MRKFFRTITVIIVELCILVGCFNVILKAGGSDLKTFASNVENTLKIAFPVARNRLMALTNKRIESVITGNNLTFDTRFYPYYGLLNEREQAVYAQIYSNAFSYSKAFSPVVEVTIQEADNAMQAMIFDHPELFWIGSGYQCSYTSDDRCTLIVFNYDFSEEEIGTAKELFESRASEIINAASDAGNVYEIEKAVHDALVSSVSYNDVDLLSGQSAYGALVSGSSVCAGYSRAFQYLMTQLGIPTYYCIGASNGDHAWNIIEIDGGYYNVDVTWDDACENRYQYFNRTDAEFSYTHFRTGMSCQLPACSASQWCGPERTAEYEVPDLPQYNGQAEVHYIEVTGQGIRIRSDPAPQIPSPEPGDTSSPAVYPTQDFQDPPSQTDHPVPMEAVKGSAPVPDGPPVFG